VFGLLPVTPLVPWNFDVDPEFVAPKNSLNNVMVQLQQDPLDAPIQAEPLTVAQLQTMFASPELSSGTPQELLWRFYVSIALATAQREIWHANLPRSEIINATIFLTSSGLR
jgi:hypothetical protein